jgi:ABC transport system ATP-binding/permease protein
VAVYLAFTLITTRWPHMNLAQWSQIYLTLTLASLSGVMLGLLLSAVASSDAVAVALIPVILIPQFVFAGILMPQRLSKIPVIPRLATSKWAMESLATITQAQMAGSESPDVEARVARERDCAIQQKIQVEGDRQVKQNGEAQYQQQLDVQAKSRTQQVVADKTELAKAGAEAAVLREMMRHCFPVPPSASEQEAQISKAKAAAAQQVAAKQPEIEAGVRADLGPPLRREVEAAIRAQVARAVLGAANDPSQPAPANPSVAEITARVGDIFHARIGLSWLGMLTIMGVLLGAILILQKRKDVV